MLKEAIEALYPPRPTASRRRIRRAGSSSASCNGSFHEKSLQFGGRTNDTASCSSSSYNTIISPRKKRMGGKSSRFSELLLDHGEKDLHQDWAVCASSSTTLGGGAYKTNNNNGYKSGISPSCQMKQIEGRLRICSQSIVFEPSQTSRGIIRAPFRYISYLGGGMLDIASSSSSSQQQGSTKEVIIRCDRHVVMKMNNVIGPFHYQQTPVEFRFQFLHSSPSAMISLAQQLFDVEASNKRLSSVTFAPSVAFDMSAPPIIPLPSSSSNNGNSNETRAAIIEQLIGPIQFDTTNFLHAQENPLTPNLQCSIKTPLLEQNGCAILTEYGLYFQPLIISGSASSGARSGTTYWPWDDMRAIARRYDLLEDKGLEIYLSKQHSILLTFESPMVRERIIHILSQQISTKKAVPLPCFTDRSFVESALELWQAGELDNFEYLLCLNSAAGRSFHDLSRYPVFPWVISRYGESNHDNDDDDEQPRLDLEDATIFRDLTKPIGALNEERFEEFRKRYESMVEQQQNNQLPQQNNNQDAPFMYGTHYSAPGYVLFYLLRVMPEHMLCLQAGKFDVADRLFHSIDATYKSALINNADVKELIPEFYDPDCFDFLINSMGLQLGNTQTGERVNDVILPAWAKSAKHFLRQNRAALESDHCTEHLPQWIDLIFGITSRGRGAKEARNLFHPMSYVGPLDLEAMRSPEDRARVELQSSEFGITPDQLFCRKHPGRKENLPVDSLMTRDHLRDSYGLDNRGFSASSLLDQSMLQNDNHYLVAENPFD